MDFRCFGCFRLFRALYRVNWAFLGILGLLCCIIGVDFAVFEDVGFRVFWIRRVLGFTVVWVCVLRFAGLAVVFDCFSFVGFVCVTCGLVCL